ncbi:MAG: hypothetical protein QOD56_601 [Gammaproteobacteria bacterium]|jgi:hypothetical protein|nr:hypothetical protein [Gammaproteobacteria bacterium]
MRTVTQGALTENFVLRHVTRFSGALTTTGIPNLVGRKYIGFVEVRE